MGCRQRCPGRRETQRIGEVMNGLRTSLALVPAALLAGSVFVSSTSAWSAPPDAGAPPGTPLAVEHLTSHVTRFAGAAENEAMVVLDTPAGAVLVDTGFAASTTGPNLRQ